MKSSARTLSLIAGAVAVAALVTGCATAATSGAASDRSPKISAEDAPRAAWLDASSLVIATRSDDGCAPMISDIVAGDQRIDVTLSPGSGECEGEQPSVHGTYLGVPAGLDSSKPMTLAVTQLGGESTLIELPGLDAGEVAPADRMPPQLPAAAWIGDGELAVLTWGSSTCVPSSGSVDGGVLTLDEPIGEVCTMDLVPRITFVPAAGMAADAVLTLSGHTDEDGAPVMLRPHPRV